MPCLRSIEDIYECELCETQGLLRGYAKLNCEATRPKEEPIHSYRAPYIRDRDRILYSEAFRRLVHKAQMINTANPAYLTTRLSHTLKVAQTAQTIARALKLNEDLAVAIALGHDVGHAPFGHLGEDFIRDEMIESNGFEHNEQSVWILMYFENLNLTWETLEGILKHTRFDFAPYNNKGVKRKDPFSEIVFPDIPRPIKGIFNYFGSENPDDSKIDFAQPASLEGQVVDISDEITYLSHDIIDLANEGYLEYSELPATWKHYFGKVPSNAIEKLVTTFIDNVVATLDQGPDPTRLQLTQPSEFGTIIEDMKSYIMDVYKNKRKSDIEQSEEMLQRVFSDFVNNPEKLKDTIYYSAIDAYGITDKDLVAHCIASMTDYEIVEYYNSL